MERQFTQVSNMNQNDIIIKKVKETLIKASSTFSEDMKQAYEKAIEKETSTHGKWVLETILENAKIAEKNKSPLCDDTGIPHLFLELGKNKHLSGEMIEAIHQGVEEGLNALPGRPMGVIGDDLQRIDQSMGLSEKSSDVLPAPMIIKNIDEDMIRLSILMQGGGPAIRGKTHRVFHKHSVDVVIEEIISWAIEGVSQLGCTPCTLAVGIGRSQLEATAMMTQAQVYGKHNVQSDIEKRITDSVNKSNTGALGLGGSTSVISTFLKIGPQRASGVRVVCLRPCCCFEPRLASVEL